MLDDKENPPPRIPKGTGDCFCKQDKRKQPFILWTPKKKKNTSMTSCSCVDTAPHTGLGDNTAFPLFEYQGSQLVYYKKREKWSLKIKSWYRAHLCWVYETHTCFTNRLPLTTGLSEKIETCLVRQPFRKIIFHKVFYTFK